MPQLTAKKSMAYPAGRRRAPGDVFDVTNFHHARVLVAVGRAGWHVAPREPEPVAAATAADSTPAKTYRTRRLKAEG